MSIKKLTDLQVLIPQKDVYSYHKHHEEHMLTDKLQNSDIFDE